MLKLEKFLNSNLYIGIVFFVAFFAWLQYKQTPPFAFNILNMIITISIITFNVFLLFKYANTTYTLPIVFSLLFIINQSTISFESINDIGFPIISLLLFLLGYVIYYIKYKPLIQKGKFFLGLFLLSIAYLMPNIYVPFEISGLVVSSMGLIYLFLYLFYLNTMKINLDYIFKLFIAINLLLVAQVFIYVYRGYIIHEELDIFSRLMIGWGRNFGWANKNDMAFYIALTFPSYLFFILKKPKSFLIWFLMLLPIIAIVFLKSRGGLISFGISLLGVVIFLFREKNKKIIFYGVSFIGFMLILAISFKSIISIWIEFFVSRLTENINDFSSFRIDIYKYALVVFRNFPLFGGGWLSIKGFPNVERIGGRLFMYHSTVFHVLATMGLFGLLALIVHYYQIYHHLYRCKTIYTSLFLIGFTATQVHGLIENVQFSVPYSIIIVLILSIFDASEQNNPNLLLGMKQNPISLS